MGKEYSKIDSTCTSVASRKAKVCLPISIKPYAETDSPIITCCGDPVIRQCHCCHGEIDKSCDFTLTQTIQIDIPVEFGASMIVGDTYVCCNCPGLSDCEEDYEYEQDCQEDIEDNNGDYENYEQDIPEIQENDFQEEEVIDAEPEDKHNTLKDDFKSLFKGNK